MSYVLKVSAAAERDVRQGFLWYEEARTGLGKEFLYAVEHALERVCENPLHYPEIQPKLRRFVVLRFPYRIFYHLTDHHVLVLAVFHTRRAPVVFHP